MGESTVIPDFVETPPHSSLRGRLYALFLRSEPIRGYALLSPTLIVMTFTMCIPFGIMVLMSFWTQLGFEFDTALTLANYERAIERPAFSKILLRSLAISGTCTLATILLSYPMAYYVAFHVHKRKLVWIILMTLPFWTSYLLRIFTWKVILGYNGAINSGLMYLGLIDEPLAYLLYSPTAIVITLTHAWAAFAILPIYVSLEKIDKSLLEAAADLGDGPIARFLRITLPLSLPGVIASTVLIFIPTVGDYVTPILVGGPDGVMIGNIIQIHFGNVNNWPMGAALAISMMLVVALIAFVFTFLIRKLTSKIA
jgi:spermidine/putrescine transport system permease protein